MHSKEVERMQTEAYFLYVRVADTMSDDARRKIACLSLFVIKLRLFVMILRETQGFGIAKRTMSYATMPSSWVSHKRAQIALFNFCRRGSCGGI